MTLLDQGWRDYASRERGDTKWLKPVEKQHFYPDWIDITDLSTDQLLEFFGCAPSQHAQRDEDQLGLF